MAFSHRIVVSYVAGSTTASFTETQEWGAESNLDESIPNGADGLEVDWTLPDRTQLKSILITSDVEMIIYTNADAGGADDTFNVGPTSGIVFWTTEHQADGAAEAQPFDADITKIFVDNGSGSAGTLKIRCSYDPTA